MFGLPREVILWRSWIDLWQENHVRDTGSEFYILHLNSMSVRWIEIVFSVTVIQIQMFQKG